MESKYWGILSGVLLVVYLFVMSQKIVGDFTGFQVLFWPSPDSFVAEKSQLAIASLVTIGLIGLAFINFAKKK
jgi:hypothetical protein